MAGGDLSTAEKLASLNPAARAEGSRELSQQTSTQQKRTVSRAKTIIKSGATGTTTLQTVSKETRPITSQGQLFSVTIDGKTFTSPKREFIEGKIKEAEVAEKAKEERRTTGLMPEGEREAGTQEPEVQRATPSGELQTGVTGGGLVDSLEAQEQEAIKKEKAEKFGLFGTAKGFGGDIIKKLKAQDFKGKFEQAVGQPLVGQGEIIGEKFPKITGFVKTTAAVAGTVVVLKQLPLSVVIPIESAFVGTFATAKAKQFKTQPLKQFAFETTLEAGAILLGGRIGAGGKPGFLKSEVVEVSTPRGTETFKVTGLELGGKGLPLVTKTKAGLEFGLPVRERIPLSELTKDIPTPETSVGGKLFTKVLELTPKESVRIKKAKTAFRILGKEKGLTVKEAVFETGLLKDPVKSSKIIEESIGKEGFLFGSQTTKQLPKEFRSTTRASDIDIVIQGKTAKEFAPKISQLTKELRGIGEPVRISTRKPTIIETVKGEKLLEFKFSGEPIISGEAVAKGGVLGFRFPDIKKSQLIKRTVPFGKAGLKAERAGTQFLRKGAGSLFATKEGLFAPQRRLKDIAGFVLSGRGLVEVRKGRIFVSGRRTRKAGKAIETIVETFTPKQKKLLELELLNIKKGRVQLDPSVTPTKLKLPSLRLPVPPKFDISPRHSVKPSTSISKVISPGLSPRISPRPSPRISPRVSPRVSPRISPRVSPAISKITSPSPSPRISPRLSSLVSPRVSPSPRIYSRVSPRISPRGSPSPSLFRGFTPPPPTKRIPVPNINLLFGGEEFKPKGRRKRQFRFTPSLVALEGRIKGKRPQVLTGIEIRPIL